MYKYIILFFLVFSITAQTTGESQDTTSDSTQVKTNPIEESKEILNESIEDYNKARLRKRFQFNDGPTTGRNLQVTEVEKHFFQNKHVATDSVLQSGAGQITLARISMGLAHNERQNSFHFGLTSGFTYPYLDYRNKFSNYYPETYFKSKKVLVSTNPYVGFIREKRDIQTEAFTLFQFGVGVKFTGKRHQFSGRFALLRGKDERQRSTEGMITALSFAPFNKGIGIEVLFTEINQTPALTTAMIFEFTNTTILSFKNE